MPAYKNKENGSWYVSAYYKNWKGEQTRKVKRGFATKRDALEWERNKKFHQRTPKPVKQLR